MLCNAIRGTKPTAHGADIHISQVGRWLIKSAVVTALRRLKLCDSVALAHAGVRHSTPLHLILSHPIPPSLAPAPAACFGSVLAATGRTGWAVLAGGWAGGTDMDADGLDYYPLGLLLSALQLSPSVDWKGSKPELADSGPWETSPKSTVLLLSLRILKPTAKVPSRADRGPTPPLETSATTATNCRG